MILNEDWSKVLTVSLRYDFVDTFVEVVMVVVVVVVEAKVVVAVVAAAEIICFIFISVFTENNV